MAHSRWPGPTRPPEDDVIDRTCDDRSVESDASTGDIASSDDVYCKIEGGTSLLYSIVVSAGGARRSGVVGTS